MILPYVFVKLLFDVLLQVGDELLTSVEFPGNMSVTEYIQ